MSHLNTACLETGRSHKLNTAASWVELTTATRTTSVLHPARRAHLELLALNITQYHFSGQTWTSAYYRGGQVGGWVASQLALFGLIQWEAGKRRKGSVAVTLNPPIRWSLLNSLPFLYHFREGIGFPLAWQRNLTVLLAGTAWSFFSIFSGWTHCGAIAEGGGRQRQRWKTQTKTCKYKQLH